MTCSLTRAYCSLELPPSGLEVRFLHGGARFTPSLSIVRRPGGD
jgi:hypothetical protein